VDARDYASEEHGDESAAASEPGDEGSFRDRQRESRERWLAMHEESERQHPIWRRSRAEGGSTERSATCPRRRAGWAHGSPSCLVIVS